MTCQLLERLIDEQPDNETCCVRCYGVLPYQIQEEGGKVCPKCAELLRVSARAVYRRIQAGNGMIGVVDEIWE